MIKVILRLDCGVGMNQAEAYLVSQEDWDKHQDPKTSIKDDFLGDYAWQEAINFAETYGIYPTYARSEYSDDDESSEYSAEYSDDIEGWFELYDPDEHDGLMVGYQKEWNWREL